ncbi:hypothetical protein AMJ80_01400 [bacterium SM23_31]|nr:MAG: hypothetical protein AMJ80_01400 [bacterium SM23_31]
MKIKVAIAQLQSEYCNLKENVRKHTEWINRAKEKDVRLVVFPELSLTGYYLREAVSEVALYVSDPYIEQIVEASQGIGVIAGFVEKGEKRKYYNCAICCENGRIVGIHRKIFLPTYDMFEEERYFTAGCILKAHKTSWGTAGIVICEDAWHPELVFKYIKKNIDVLVIMSASPVKGITADKGIKNKETNYAINRFYARNLGIPVLFANKIGYEHGIFFWGGSAVYAPDGKIVAHASTETEELLISDIQIGKNRNT